MNSYIRNIESGPTCEELDYNGWHRRHIDDMARDEKKNQRDTFKSVMLYYAFAAFVIVVAVV